MEPFDARRLLPLWMVLFALLLLLAAGFLLLQGPVERRTAALAPLPSATSLASDTPTPTRTPTRGPTLLPNTGKAATLTPAGPTPTSTLTPTITPTPTASFTPLPTLSPGALPAPAYSAYTLKPWTEDDAVQAVNETGSAYTAGATPNDRLFSSITMMQEAMLRFPQRTVRERYLVQILADLDDHRSLVYASAHGLSPELIAFSLERALNAGGLQYGQEADWLTGLTIRAGSIDAPDFFGDRRRSELLLVQLAQSSMEARLVVHETANGIFQVQALSPDWVNILVATDEQFRFVSAGLRGRPLIAVTSTVTSPQDTCTRSLRIYQWNGLAFQDLTATPIDESSAPFVGRCDAFAINGGGNSLTVGAKITSDSACANHAFDYTKTTTYAYDGNEFIPTAAKVEPLLGTQPLFCAIDWARKAGPDDLDAVSLLLGAFNNWPIEANDAWGPASEDFFKLRAAQWLIQAGKVDQALPLLQSVRDQPAYTGNKTAQTMAASFLSAYQSEGLYQAIVQSQQTRAVDVDWLAGSGASQRDFWGFGEPEERFTSIFQISDPLSLTLARTRPSNTNDVVSWFQRNSIPLQSIVEADVNGDGSGDWVALYGNNQLAALVHTEQGLQIVPVLLPSNDAVRSFSAYAPAPSAPMITLVQTERFLLAFHIDRGKVITDLLHPLSQPSAVDPAAIFSWRTETSGDLQTLVVNYDGSQSDYAWDLSLGKLRPGAGAPELQEPRVVTIERAIFIIHDYTQAAQLIQDMLAGKLWEPYPPHSASASTPILRPYLQYLLGLSYEMMLDQPDSIAAYWNLWKAYPESPFTLVARRKLVATGQ